MSAASKVKQILIQTEEPGNCPACDSHLWREHIFRYVGRSPGERMVRAYCHACTAVYQVHQELSGGIWRDIGEVEIVTHVRVLASVLERVAKLAGDRQIA